MSNDVSLILYFITLGNLFKALIKQITITQPEIRIAHWGRGQKFSTVTYLPVLFLQLKNKTLTKHNVKGQLRFAKKKNFLNLNSKSVVRNGLKI